MKLHTNTNLTDLKSNSTVFSKGRVEKTFFTSFRESKNLFFGPSGIQSKLKIGQPDDKYEQEADRVADAVMRMPEQAVLGKQGVTEGAAGIQRQQDTSSPSSCPTFVSLTIRSQTPSVNVCRTRCRMGIGCCTTPRGQCGSTGTGAVMRGKIRVFQGCTGELALMQNLLTTDRRRTLNNGTRECMNSDQTLRDGGIPWKGCTLNVNSPGEHTITSEDCPNIRLRDNMVATSANDSFKTFLLWKPNGTRGRRPIANATWGWSASARRQQNIDGDCTDQWTITNPSKTDGNGSTSTEQPVTNPTAQDLSWELCSSS